MTAKKSKFYVLRQPEVKNLHAILLGKSPANKDWSMFNGYWSLPLAKEALTPTKVDMGYGIYDSRLDNWIVKPEEIK
jgi:hypothetical protein